MVLITHVAVPKYTDRLQEVMLLNSDNTLSVGICKLVMRIGAHTSLMSKPRNTRSKVS